MINFTFTRALPTPFTYNDPDLQEIDACVLF